MSSVAGRVGFQTYASSKPGKSDSFDWKSAHAGYPAWVSDACFSAPTSASIQTLRERSHTCERGSPWHHLLTRLSVRARTKSYSSSSARAAESVTASESIRQVRADFPPSVSCSHASAAARLRFARLRTSFSITRCVLNRTSRPADPRQHPRCRRQHAALTSIHRRHANFSPKRSERHAVARRIKRDTDRLAQSAE